MQVREYLAKIAERSIVLISTHVVEDVAQMADQVSVLANGVVVFTGSVSDLRDAGDASEQNVSMLESGYRSIVAATR